MVRPCIWSKHDHSPSKNVPLTDPTNWSIFLKMGQREFFFIFFQALNGLEPEPFRTALFYDEHCHLKIY